MIRFMIMGGDSCPFCVQAKDTLEAHNFDYTWVDVKANEKERQKLKDQGFKTIPQIWYGDTHVGGYTDLIGFLGDLDAIKKGQLQENDLEQHQD